MWDIAILASEGTVIGVTIKYSESQVINTTIINEEGDDKFHKPTF